jgi:Cu/Ag efflux pump CusA
MTSFARVHHVAAHGLRHKHCASGICWRRCSPFSFGACTLDPGFCFVSALAGVQAWLVASEIAKARTLCGNIRNARYRGAQAKFRAVSLVGLCAIVGLLSLEFGESSGAQGRFATVMFGGVLFSTIAALTVLPLVIAQLAE